MICFSGRNCINILNGNKGGGGGREEGKNHCFKKAKETEMSSFFGFFLGSFVEENKKRKFTFKKHRGRTGLNKVFPKRIEKKRIGIF